MRNISKRAFLLGTGAATASGIFAPLAIASKETLVGTWTLVSTVRELEDGRRINVMGDNPKGLMTFDAGGRFSHQLMRAEGGRFDCDAIKVASDENRAAAIGISSYFGTYELAATGDSIVLNIEASALAQQIGLKQRRSIKVTGDTMEYWTPRIESAGGAFVRKLIWRRES
jgi:hypothetical protein